MSKLYSVLQGVSNLMYGFVFVFESMWTWASCLFGIDQTAETTERKFSLTASDRDAFMKDREALAADWKKIGGDMRKAMDEYVKTH